MRWCFNESNEIPSRVSNSVGADSFLGLLSHSYSPAKLQTYRSRTVFRSSLVEDNPSVTFFIVAVKALVVSEESIPLGKHASQNPDVQ